MAKALDLSGQHFGRLVAQGWMKTAKGQRSWRCICDCGNIAVVLTERLRNGETTSCGCLVRDMRQRVRHGLHYTDESTIWSSMKARCYNPNSDNFKDYGGRGIIVCERWRNDLAAFVADVGRRPTKKHSIDRIDNNGDYEPGNCRWATASEQALNRRKRNPQYRVLVDGVPLHQLAVQHGLRPTTVLRRYRQGVRGDVLFSKSLVNGRHNARRVGIQRPDICKDAVTGRFVKRHVDGTVSIREAKQ